MPFEFLGIPRLLHMDTPFSLTAILLDEDDSEGVLGEFDREVKFDLSDVTTFTTTPPPPSAVVWRSCTYRHNGHWCGIRGGIKQFRKWNHIVFYKEKRRYCLRVNFWSWWGQNNIIAVLGSYTVIMVLVVVSSCNGRNSGRVQFHVDANLFLEPTENACTLNMYIILYMPGAW